MRPDLEPCTIDADVVATFLERNRRPRMAEYVRDLAKPVARAAEMYELMRRQCEDLAKRLATYETPQTYEPCTGVPPPESSD